MAAPSSGPCIFSPHRLQQHLLPLLQLQLPASAAITSHILCLEEDILMRVCWAAWGCAMCYWKAHMKAAPAQSWHLLQINSAISAETMHVSMHITADAGIMIEVSSGVHRVGLWCVNKSHLLHRDSCTHAHLATHLTSKYCSQSGCKGTALFGTVSEWIVDVVLDHMQIGLALFWRLRFGLVQKAQLARWHVCMYSRKLMMPSLFSLTLGWMISFATL